MLCTSKSLEAEEFSMKKYLKTIFVQGYGKFPCRIVLDDYKINFKSLIGICNETIYYYSIKNATYSTIYPKVKIEYYNNESVESIIILTSYKCKMMKEFQSKDINCIKYSNPHKNIFKRIIYWFKFWD